MYGKCGTKCSDCPAFIKNIKTYEDQVKCSVGWKKFLDIPLSPELCVCYGCQSKEIWKKGNVIPLRSCLVKRCVDYNNFDTCANCKDYPCGHVEENNKLIYTRDLVENKLGYTMTDEDYRMFVESYNNVLHIKKLRESISSDKIKNMKKLQPLDAKMINKGLVNDSDIDLYNLIYKINSCEFPKNYVDQILMQRLIKNVLVILWVFGRDGVLSEDGNSISIHSKNVIGLKEYKSIIRKRDNYWHDSVAQSKKIFEDVSLSITHNRLSRKDWCITLKSQTEFNKRNVSILKILKEKVVYLNNIYNDLEYVSSWKYKGEAFSKFTRGIFN